MVKVYANSPHSSMGEFQRIDTDSTSQIEKSLSIYAAIALDNHGKQGTRSQP
jgi:hypothetical protein